MKNIYVKFCKIEEVIAAFLLSSIAVLVFVSALARTMKHPINWGQDLALMAFAWMIFIGGDVVMKSSKLIGIDMILLRLPKCMQKWMTVLFDLMMMAFLCILIKYGFSLVATSIKRTVTTLGISYAWTTLAVPVGSALMLLSITINLVKDLRTPVSQWR